MKALRVLKWLSFIVFILALSLAIVANGFVICEMNICNKDASDDITMSTIIQELDKVDGFKLLFGKEAKEEANEEPVEITEQESDVVTEVETPVITEEVTETEEPVVTEDAINEKSIEPEIPATEDTDTLTGSSGSLENPYSLEGKNNIIVAVMRLGTQTININWISDNVKITILDYSVESEFEIAVSMLVAFAALFLAFLLHIISKSHKSFIGIILMIIGYSLFAVIFVTGYFVCSTVIGYFADSLNSDDWQLYRLIAITSFNFFAGLIGLPIYVCGIQRMTIRRLKKRRSAKLKHH